MKTKLSLFQILTKLGIALKNIIAKSFGSITYNPPNWIQKTLSLLAESVVGKKWQELRGWILRNPGKFQKLRLGVLSSFLVCLAAWYGFNAYINSIPKPDYVKVSLEKPRPTNPEDGIPNQLAIVFDKSVAKTTDLNKIIAQGVKINPVLEGAWHWESDHQLTFRLDPTKKLDWAVGTTYEVSFQKDFFPEHIILENYQLKFETDPLKMHVTKQEFYIDPRDPKSKKILVNLQFNYPINADDFKQRVEFELKTEGLNLLSSAVKHQVSFNKYFTEVYLQSEPLRVMKENQKMFVKIEKGTKPQAEGPSTQDYQNIQVNIPGLYEAFKIQSISAAFARNEKFEPEQILVIRTAIQTRSEDLAQKLKVYLLPKNLPAIGSRRAVKNYRWRSAAEISAEVRSALQEVKFTLIPSEAAWSLIHTFKIKEETQRSLLVSVQKGLQGLGDYELRDTFESPVWLENFPRELQIMSRGALLTLSGELKIPLLARNIERVKFTISRIIPEQVNHLLPQLNSEIQNPSLPYDLENNIAEKFEAALKLKLESAQATQYFSLDLEPYLNKAAAQRGVFLIEAAATDANGSELGPTDKRLIMVTDLGILVKESVSKTNDVYVENFKTGLPVEGATVEVIGRNGIPVLKGVSDSQGHAAFPNLSDFRNEKAPVAFSVRKGMDQAFLPYKNHQQYLQYSRFDVGGLVDHGGSDQLMSMVFSDRGIYRPGESTNVGLIVRPRVGHGKLKAIPLQWSVTNSRGQEILKEKIFVDSSDLKSLNFKTDETSPTGTYDIRVFVIKRMRSAEIPELIGSLSVKVEEFQPDRMKISTHLSQEKLSGWIKPTKINSFVDLKNLFGTAAEKRRVRGVMTLTPAQPNFKAYKDYIFTNLNKPEEQVYSETLEELTTNAEGHAEFTLDLSKYTANLFNMRFEAEGFENEGGRSVHATTSVLVSPLDYLLGAKSDGDLTYLKKQSERNLHLIAIDLDLKKVEAGDIEYQVVEKKYVSVLTQQNDGSFKYQSVLKESPGETKTLKVSAVGSKFKIDTSKAGDFGLIFRNKAQTELLKLNYTVVGEENLSRSLEKNSELQLVLNKADFQPNEEIELQIKAPYKGAGLISIEREGVYAVKWFKTQGTSAIEKIKIPAGLEGNAYVNVTFLRAIDSPEIFASPLSYAVVPFSISLDEKRTKIKLESPERVRPGEKLKITYSTSKKTDLILYGVDEGILQVAKYRLPDPLEYFFQKRALQVRTYQILDLLLPEFSLVNSSQSSGGDSGTGALGKNLNPFKSKRAKPVVFWSGVLKSDLKAQTYSFEVPDYFNGNIKIMAVAASDLGLGSTEIASVVRGDFIVSPTTPVFVAPQDEFVVSVGVSNQLEKSGEKAKIDFETTSTDHFKVVEGQKLNLEISEGHEAQTSVRVKTQSKLGEGILTFRAGLGKSSGSSRSEISVRPAFPYSQSLSVGLLDRLPLEFVNLRDLHPEFAKAKVTVSPLPMVIGVGLMNYLETYPYGCTEQVVSRAMPALILRSRSDFIANAESQREYFKAALQILQSRQMPDGGFALYSPQFEGSNPMASLYAIHYLIEARERKLPVPEGMLQHGQSFLESFKSSHSPHTLTDHRRWAYSLYLLARLGVVNGAGLGELKRSIDSQLKDQPAADQRKDQPAADQLKDQPSADQWRTDPLAIYLAGIYKLYKQDEAGARIISGLKIGSFKITDWDDYLDPVVRDSLLIYVTAKHFPNLLNEVIDPIKLKGVLEPISQGQYNTHSAAYLLLALDAMAEVPDSNQALSEIKVDQQLLKDQWKAVSRGGKPSVSWQLAPNHLKARIDGPQMGTLFYSYHVSGFDKSDLVKEVKQTIEVSKDILDRTGSSIDKAKIGEEFEVSLRVRSLDEKAHTNIAIVDLVPGGFEMVLDPVRNSIDGTPSNIGDEGSLNSEESTNDPSQGPTQNPIDEDEPTGDEVHDGASLLDPTLLDPWLKWFSRSIIAHAQTKKEAGRTRLNPLAADFVDKREDRVVVYTTVTRELSELTYRIKAVNQGTFMVPPAFAEGMYDRSKKYQGHSKMVTVIAP
jgi:uncharacterized protein YfaS (alpha-2-macroglobulin family)